MHLTLYIPGPSAGNGAAFKVMSSGSVASPPLSHDARRGDIAYHGLMGGWRGRMRYFEAFAAWLGVGTEKPAS